MTRRIAIIASLLAWLAAFAVFSCCARVYGQVDLRPNDPTYDNGLAVTANTVIREPVTAPGGLYWQQTPLDLGKRDSVELDFQGTLLWSRLGRAEKSSGVVFLYRGDPAQPAVRMSGYGQVARGLNIWRSEYESREPIEGTGLLLQPDGGKWHVEDFTAAGFEHGIHITHERVHGGNARAEHNLFEHLHFFSCRNNFYFSERQAVSHKITSAHSYGNGETFFKFAPLAGASLSVDTMGMTVPRLLIDYPHGNPNSATITIHNLRIDPAAKGWRLVRHVKGPLSLTVRGHVAPEAEPAADAIQVGPDAKIDVKLNWRGKVWPEDFQP
jgi:hypothetical protein